MKPSLGTDTQHIECLDINSDGKTVYTRYIGEQHVREDCNNYIPTAKEWVDGIQSKERPIWMMKTMKLEIED